ncbi:ATP-binding protein [Caballeronia sordidicola]|uniref:ATP-binding protein n=1 Tax=Caballeronia sordidicola TaxID=196367 RepID=UPI0004D00C51|nr:ATP-binding protein [Caballeronia sordidicola]
MAKLRIQTAPGEGERRAQRGYVRQYESAAAAIYAALERDELVWVGLADRNAGVADDVVLGLKGSVVGHQFKTSRYSGPFRLDTLLLGADGLLQPLVLAWQALRRAFPDGCVEVRLVTNDYPSNADVLDGEDGHSAAFLREFMLYPNRTLADWRASRWQPFVDRLVLRSGVDDAAFEQFLQALRILWGPAADFAQAHRLSPDARRLAGEIASLLPRLVADVRDRDRWTRSQLLEELGWPDSFIVRRSHQFPVGAYVQRNAVTEMALRRAINEAGHGYVALVGSPGVGKSTLLQSSLAAEPALAIVRYLAFVPGEGQGIGRGEAEAFLDDVNAQLRRGGLSGLRFRDTTLQERRDQFGIFMQRAGERFQRDGVRTLIIVDGLDHIPREEVPQRSLLAELPLPQAVPEGVLFVLGTQRLDLDDLKPAIQEQASLSHRRIVVAPLSREAVYRMTDAYGLDPDVSRERILTLGHGQPLVTRYLINALRHADNGKREGLLAGQFTFEGDIETIYASAWREINDDAQARDVMSFIARAEGPIQPEQLADAVSEQAVERALASTAHLLSVGPNGWAVFHNSFRLFILSKPRLRFGKPDVGDAPRIYVRLAELARVAATGSPQRWLELRYLARAQRHRDVLALAQPVRFRNQLADGRPAADIEADIRLAFGAAQAEGDPTDVFRLLLAQDEIGRRANALEYAPSVVDAMLAIADIDGAQSFAEANGCGGYKIVDALLSAGQVDRARAWFDRIEPLERFWGNQSDGVRSQESELREWAQRVFHFREVDQINDAIERLSNPALARTMSNDPDYCDHLRFDVACAAARAQPTGDLQALARQLGVSDTDVPYLLIEAGLSAQRSGDAEIARALLSQAVSKSTFSQVQEDWRGLVARSAAELGDIAMARAVFAHLTPPAIAMMEGKTGDGVAKTVARAFIEYVELGTLLGETLSEVASPKRSLLQPLQHHAIKVGELLGRARSGEAVPGVELVRATHDALAYLEHAEPRAADEFYAIHQLDAAAPILAHALIHAAALCGEEAFTDVVAEFDRAFAKPNGKNRKRIDLRREVAAEIYHQTGDLDAACQRLDPLAGELREDTPETQVEGLAALATTFASVGTVARARQLLHQLHNESLGYARAPKKDPQYALWRDLLQRANAADPAKLRDRVELMMRLLDGMMETEGRASGRRIASAVLTEAALIDATTGLVAAKKMAARSMLDWAGIINALLLGVVRRRPDLAGPCAMAWASLALPYYSEPLYRSDKLGEFISTVIAASPEHDLVTLIDQLCVSIETNAQASTRTPLLERLAAAMGVRGAHNSRVDEALVRWRAETPAERDSGTPGRYDNVTSLGALEARLRDEALDAPDYEGIATYARLVATAELGEARTLFERWAALQNDTNARFALVTRALSCGDLSFARSLVEGYRLQTDERATWNYWTGAGRLKYFQARVKIEGAVVHDEAYADLVGELAGGREYVQPILFDIEDVFPTIASSLDWAAMWECLAEQLTMMREYAIGTPFELPPESGITDEDLIVSIYRWALSLSLPELTSNLRRGALHLLSFDAGVPLFTLLVGRLLEGEGDEAAEAVQLLLHDAENTAAPVLGEVIAPLVDDPDYAVAAGAARLLKRWGRARAITHTALPFFYEIYLDEGNADRFERPKLSDSRTGAMHVEDPLGWTFAFSDVIRALARKGVSVLQIRERCRIFIEGWGGLAAFGPSATVALEAALGRIDMRLAYARPHMTVALRALRYVAGEMSRAGILDEKDEPWLLHLMGYPASPMPLVSPCERPRTITRPALDRTHWHETEERWLDAVDGDVQPLLNRPGKVIAEFARFDCRDIRTTFSLERLRVPFFDVCKGDDLSSWMLELPQAIWAGSIVPLSDEPAATIVRRFEETRVPGVPSDMLVICPFWLRRLSWQQHPEDWLAYLDKRGRVVARVVWWRDGGPIDIGEDGIWGEGAFVMLTPEGCQQIEAVTGRMKIQVHGRRTVAEPGKSTVKVRRASAVE